MKTPRPQLTEGRACGLSALTTLASLVLRDYIPGKIPRWGLMAAATLLWIAVAPPLVCAATTTPYTATSVAVGHPYAGVWMTNDTGQVSLHGDAQVFRVDSSDTRLTGRRTVLSDGTFNPDGSAILYGTAFQELGTWDDADPDNPGFTPGVGCWEMNWRGVMQTDYSMQLSLAGHGVGGSIDGLQVEETLNRDPAAGLIDFTVPCLYAGAIRSAPVSTSQVVDNFDDNLLSWNIWGSGTARETNQQLTLRVYYPGVHTHSIMDSSMMVYRGGSWTVPSGMTFEWRVDLVSLDETAPNMTALAVGNDNTGKYFFSASRDFAYLWKWPAANGEFTFSILAGERVQLRNSNIVLALALTRTSSDVVITGRVLDKTDSNSVLYQCSFLDTPAADPTINSNQFQSLTGMSMRDLGPDRGAPISLLGAYAWLGLGQYTDGTLPAAEATFDNLELRTYEVPTVAIERAVQLTWPAPAGVNYTVEAAPTVQGPFLPVQEMALPGLQKLTVPVNPAVQFFRLQQAP